MHAEDFAPLGCSCQRSASPLRPLAAKSELAEKGSCPIPPNQRYLSQATVLASSLLTQTLPLSLLPEEVKPVSRGPGGELYCELGVPGILVIGENKPKPSPLAPFLARAAEVHICCINRKTEGQLVKNLFTSSCSRTPRIGHFENKALKVQKRCSKYFLKAGIFPFLKCIFVVPCVFT